MKKKQNADGKPQSKADFVRSMPATMKPFEIIAEGKKAGLEISAANVHATRYQDKANGHAPKKKLSKVKPKMVRVLKATKGKASASTLAKYPNMRKASNGHEEDSDASAAALTGMVSGLRLLVRLSVREEIRSLMGGVFELKG